MGWAVWWGKAPNPLPPCTPKPSLNVEACSWSWSFTQLNVEAIRLIRKLFETSLHLVMTRAQKLQGICKFVKKRKKPQVIFACCVKYNDPNKGKNRE